MAKKRNRVSINKLEKHCDLSTIEIIEEDFQVSSDETAKYEIKYRLSLKECILFVQDVVNECVRPNDTMFLPIARQFITNRNILTYYANFTMPEDIDKTFDLVMGSTDIVENILKVIDPKQFAMLVKAIDDGIAFEQQKMISVQEQKISSVVSEVNQFVARMSELFDGVNGEDMASFINGISRMPSVTADDLAQAVVNRTNSNQ